MFCASFYSAVVPHLKKSTHHDCPHALCLTRRVYLKSPSVFVFVCIRRLFVVLCCVRAAPPNVRSDEITTTTTTIGPLYALQPLPLCFASLPLCRSHSTVCDICMYIRTSCVLLPSRCSARSHSLSCYLSTDDFESGMSGLRMGPAMASTELSSLPLAPSNRDRLLRAGFRTLRDVEGVQPLDLSRGEMCTDPPPRLNLLTTGLHTLCTFCLTSSLEVRCSPRLNLLKTLCSVSLCVCAL